MRSSIPWGLIVPIWKINFCSSVLQLSELPRCKERLQTAICCFESLLGRLKCPATGLDVSSLFLSTSRRWRGNSLIHHLRDVERNDKDASKPNKKTNCSSVCFMNERHPNLMEHEDCSTAVTNVAFHSKHLKGYRSKLLIVLLKGGRYNFWGLLDCDDWWSPWWASRVGPQYEFLLKLKSLTLVICLVDSSLISFLLKLLQRVYLLSNEKSEGHRLWGDITDNTAKLSIFLYRHRSIPANESRLITYDSSCLLGMRLRVICAVTNHFLF